MSLVRSISSPLRSCIPSARRRASVQIASASTSTQAITDATFRPPPPMSSEEYLPSRIKPIPASFYTTRPTYIDSLLLLEDLTRRTKRALEKASLPLSQSNTKSTDSRIAISWLQSEELGKRLGIPIKSSQYRHVVARLKALQKYRPQVRQFFLEGQYGPNNRSLALKIEETLNNFSRDKGISTRLQADQFYSKSTHMDSLGRAYARGRRKEGSARVWMVPKQINADTEGSSLLSQSVLVNLKSLPDAFSRVSDREAILYPLRLTGLLGAMNIFALVRGGGSSGQAGALSHGVARAIVTFFDHQAKEAEQVGAENANDLRQKAISIRDILAKDGVLIRDPRMVERKKTGLGKARKAYTWVKR